MWSFFILGCMFDTPLHQYSIHICPRRSRPRAPSGPKMDSEVHLKRIITSFYSVLQMICVCNSFWIIYLPKTQAHTKSNNNSRNEHSPNPQQYWVSTKRRREEHNRNSHDPSYAERAFKIEISLVSGPVFRVVGLSTPQAEFYCKWFLCSARVWQATSNINTYFVYEMKQEHRATSKHETI